MKHKKLILGMTLIAVGFTSCKNAEEKKAEKSVDTYVVYVDSIENVAAVDAKTNWDVIDNAYQLKFTEAELALKNIKEKEKAQEKIDASKAKYEVFKAQIEAELKAAAYANAKQQMRNALFGEGKIGEDLNFDWVNKDNILGVYSQFVNTVSDNKDNYTREDWDEIKLLYEALDSRKNTVEKEGLTFKDNKSIAELKLKFAPVFTFNRMGAKTEEMEKAKE